jgi:hypothetical protein
MPDYRFYSINKDGRIAAPAEIHALPNDEAAVKEAKTLLKEDTIEIWEGARIVYRLEPARK